MFWNFSKYCRSVSFGDYEIMAKMMSDIKCAVAKILCCTELHILLWKHYTGVLPWSSSSVLDHRSLSPVFESQCGQIWWLFHLWLCFITFGGQSAHLAYHVHKSGCKMSIIIIWKQYFDNTLNMCNIIIYSKIGSHCNLW